MRKITLSAQSYEVYECKMVDHTEPVHKSRHALDDILYPSNQNSLEAALAELQRVGLARRFVDVPCCSSTTTHQVQSTNSATRSSSWSNGASGSPAAFVASSTSPYEHAILHLWLSLCALARDSWRADYSEGVVYVTTEYAESIDVLSLQCLPGQCPSIESQIIDGERISFFFFF